jgi:hypothetical protein
MIVLTRWFESPSGVAASAPHHEGEEVRPFIEAVTFSPHPEALLAKPKSLEGSGT